MLLRVLAVRAAGFTLVGSAAARYSARVIKIVPNSAPGTGPDITARLVAAKLTEQLRHAGGKPPRSERQHCRRRPLPNSSAMVASKAGTP